MSLIWNPMFAALKECAEGGNNLTACISAFATADAVEKMLKFCDKNEFYFITRWRVAELAIGVSDLAVYELLRSNNISLYINYRLHSKLFRFADGRLLCGSCNATTPGLGLSEAQNIETACFVTGTTIEDEIELKKLRDSSLLVDDQIYREFADAVSECPPPPPMSTGEVAIYQQHQQDDLFLLSDLPATSDPEDLMKALQHAEISKLPEQMVIDCISFGITEKMCVEDALRQLSIGFRDSPFVRLVVEKIRQEGAMSFGAMTSFIHDHCRDVPAPYRSEVKQTVNTIYNWLCFYFDDLSCDVPGARSQIIRTNRRLP